MPKDDYAILKINQKKLNALSKPAKSSLVQRHYIKIYKSILNNKHLTADKKQIEFKKIDKARLSILNAIHSNTVASAITNELWINSPPQKYLKPIEIDGQSLTIDAIVLVARFGSIASITNDKEVIDKISASCAFIQKTLQQRKAIYGVTTNFGGLANIHIPYKDIVDLQYNLFNFLKAGTGNKISVADVRAGMLLRANSLLKGVSGIRLKLINRFIELLNLKLTPIVYEFGSIGASGDLIPLADVGGAILGLNSYFNFDYKGKEIPAPDALKKFNLPKLNLLPKEALAILNGTSMSLGIAANCIYDAKLLLNLSLAAHALIIQALGASNQSFDDFIHLNKPHYGQLWTARKMRSLINGSKLIKDELKGEIQRSKGELIQDLYSIRCLAQYTGIIASGMEDIAEIIEVEANSATDNPLIDTQNSRCIHGGNFLAEQISVAMDELRFYMSLLAKHLDVQVACLVTPAFNNGLPPSLIGNTKSSINSGLKGLQLCANSISPLLTFLGNHLASLYPTHAEQYNQNINSQSFQSALLAHRSIEVFQQYLAIVLLFGLQAVSLKSYQQFRAYDPRKYLSPCTASLCELLYQILGKKISKNRPLIYNDNEQALDQYIALLTNDIKLDKKIPHYIYALLEKNDITS